jgi:hypothetical protein
MTEFDLCGYVASAIVLYGVATFVRFPRLILLHTTRATDQGIMLFGMCLTLVLFLVGLAGLA